MYEWFQQMLAEVRAPRFFVVDGPAQADLRAAIAAEELGLPESYKQFVLQFGGAKLFRGGGGYLIEVFAGPRRISAAGDGNLIQFGRTDLAPACFAEDQLTGGTESPVLEFDREQGLLRIAGGFEAWLRQRCQSARTTFDSESWSRLCLGPIPFTAEEQELVDARKHFLWRTIGISPDNQILFELTNTSSYILPYLSIGIRRRRDTRDAGPQFGTVWIPTASVLPGETRVIAVNCYSDFIDPHEVDPFALPDPQPEDRNQYWEFRDN